MGRKIPGKKHRGIKDPYVQRKQRFAAIKGSVNNPPAKGKEDEQEMPKSVIRIMQLKEKANRLANTPKAKKKARLIPLGLAEGKFNVIESMGKDRTLPGMKKPDRYMPNLSQREDENLPQLAHRLHETAKKMMQELSFEKKFNVEVKRDESGQVLEVKQNKRQRRSKKSKLSEKRKEREEKKIAGREVEVDFPKRDKFEFGDIVHAPPANLTLPARKGKQAVGRKPGKTDLLLKKTLSGKDKETNVKTSTLEKQRIEARRQAAVDAFRQLKIARSGTVRK